MRSFKVIKDPEAFQLLADETRRRIIYLLRAKEMTVAQIAEELKLTPQAIYHHIRKLKDADMVEVAREERVDHFIETYYRATAEMFNMAHGQSGSEKVMEEETREALSALDKVGLKVEVDAELVTKVVELMKNMKEPGSTTQWTEKVNELDDLSFLSKQALLEFITLMAMNDKEFETFLKCYRELRKTLRSTLQEPMAIAVKS
ncbi:MAG TPA: metalloregulator ArsR/SmtB family transcription factor [Thermoplasmata archaeon]|nr:metalloregulator ArsR/SmtB family transcription factor [Thermoplasmata archaeon]